MPLLARLKSLFLPHTSRAKEHAALRLRRSFLEPLESRHLMAGFTLDPEWGTGGVVTSDLFAGTDSTTNAVAVQSDGKLLIAGGGYFAGEVQRANLDGTSDLTFGQNGAISFQGVAYGVAQQDDGKIVVTGRDYVGRFALARYLSDGRLDPTFDVDETITYRWNFNNARSVILTDDNKVVVTGKNATGDQIFVARFNSNGALDESFGSAGAVTFDVRTGFNDPLSLASQSDGKIVVATTGGDYPAKDFVLARFDTMGRLDESFGGGVVKTDISGPDDLSAMAIQDDGKIIVSGFSGYLGGVLLRYNGDGTLDETFDGDGRLIASSPAKGLALQADGKIVIAGSQTVPLAGGQYATSYIVKRYETDGSLDPTFDGDGVTSTELPVRIDGRVIVALQSDDRIVVASPKFDGLSHEPLLMRFSPEGNVDRSFGIDGLATYGAKASLDYAADAVRQPDGKILVVGTSASSQYNWAVVRYHADGTLDASFGDRGRVITDFGGGSDWGRSIALQADGKILVAGRASSNSGARMAVGLARYHPDGSLDSTFSGDGKALFDLDVGDDQVSSLVVQPDGKILVACSSAYRAAILRFNVDGSLDSTFGQAGVAFRPLSGASYVQVDMTLQSDGKLVLAMPGNSSGGLLTRFHADGSLDTMFGSDGTTTVAVGTGRLLQQADGKLLVVGNGSIARLDQQGQLDRSFNGTGITRTLPGFLRSGTLQGDGKLVVAAGSRSTDAFGKLWRINSDGTQDMTFGDQGEITVQVPGKDLWPTSLQISDDGRLLLVGDFESQNRDLALISLILDTHLAFTLAGDPPVVRHDSGPQIVENLATLTSGRSSPVHYEVLGNDNPSLFSTLPAIDNAGTLTYTSAENASGKAAVEVRAVNEAGDSSETLTFLITIRFNHAPELDANVPVTLAPVAEDTVTPAGTLVSALVAGISDVDANAVAGIAVTAVDNSGGVWQYTLNGTTWLDFGNPTGAAARLLPADASARVRFVPELHFTGTRSLTLSAWDQTEGMAGGTADLSVAGATGGETAFSVGEVQATVAVTPVNHAPSISALDPFDPIEEDSNPSGMLVSSLLTHVIDRDAGALRGIAVSGVTNDFGKWQYSRNGGVTWIDFGGPTRSAARLLPADELTRIRLLPKANANYSGHIWFFAWDQTQGKAGDIVDLSIPGSTGGTTAFSDGVVGGELFITPVNDAPVLDPNMGVVLPEIPEETTNPGAGVLAPFLAGVTEIDTTYYWHYQKGIALTGVDGSAGTWQYSGDGGSSWGNFPAATASAAFLMPLDPRREALRIRFVPHANFSGNTTLTYRAWDQSQGTAWGFADLSTPGAVGGTTAFSAVEGRATITVTAVNDAPVLSTGTPVTVDSVIEDTASPTGTLVSSLVGGITDVDPGAIKGLAVSGVSNANGLWQYSLNGTTWLNFGGPTRAAARLLAADATTRIRFKPNANFNGTSSIWLFAWDRTQGTAGDTADLSTAGTTGGTTAFSTALTQAFVTVTPVNDAPVLNTGVAANLDPIAEDTAMPAGTLVSSLVGGVSDVDAGAVKGIAVSSVNTFTGTWQYTLNGTDWLNFDTVSKGAVRLLPADATTRVRMIPNSNYNGTTSMWFFAWDQTQGTAGDTANLTIAGSTGGTTAFSNAAVQAFLSVTPVDDKPVLGGISGSIGYTLGNSAVIVAPAATVSDVDSSNFDTGELLVHITNGASAANQLELSGFTIGPGDAVMQGTTQIGTRESDGLNGNDLRITLNANATLAVVQQLLRAVTFRATGTTGGRTLVFSVSDGDGETNLEVSKTVSVS